jgi:hypothetical protein
MRCSEPGRRLWLQSMRPVSRGAELASLRPMSIWSGLNVALLALWKTNYRGCTLPFSELRWAEDFCQNGSLFANNQAPHKIDAPLSARIASLELLG